MGVRAARRLGAAVLLAFAVAVPAATGAAEETVRALGSPGLLWGRLAAEEESPDGPWTPLAGVEVTVYPYLPEVLADLERVRQSARESGRQFETAAARVQEILRGYKKRLEGAASDGASALVRRQVTDPMGVFVFEDLPSGEWLVVATRTTPYTSTTGHESRKRSGQGARFLAPSGRGQAQEAEIWVVRLRLGAGERTRLLLTDRARWLVAPVR